MTQRELRHFFIVLQHLHQPLYHFKLLHLLDVQVYEVIIVLQIPEYGFYEND
jgi:hypothetical protein